MYGHGVFVYDPREAKAKHGTWDAAAKAISDMDMSHAWIRAHNKNGLWLTQENKALASALKNRGIKVFAWGWCDGNSVDRDIANVNDALAEFSPDGYVADIEHGVQGASWTTMRVKRFCKAVREIAADIPFIVSTFGFLPYHEPHLMKAADPYVNAFAPQVYWFSFPNERMLSQPGANGVYQKNNAASYVNLCLDVWRHVVTKPIIVTGQVYWGEGTGWGQDDAESKVREFTETFNRYDDIAGLNWWHFAGDKAMSSGMASTIAAARFGSRLSTADGSIPPAVKPPATVAVGERAYVGADALNLRTEPGDDPSTVIAALDIGLPVDILGDSPVAGWKKISVETADHVREGYVFGKYLRAPESDNIEVLLHSAYEEWFRFQRGKGPEVAHPFRDYIAEMWEALGFDERDGADTEFFWSAAFISWVVRKAEYKDFLFSALHANYIHQLIRRRQLEIEGPFWGFRLNEHRPALGDIVCQWRKTLDAQGNQITIDYDYAEDHDTFSGHADIVVQVNDQSVRAIGGNTGQDEFNHTGSVSMKNYRLTPAGFLIEENRVFAIMKNNFR